MGISLTLLSRTPLKNTPLQNLMHEKKEKDILNLKKELNKGSVCLKVKVHLPLVYVIKSNSISNLSSSRVRMWEHGLRETLTLRFLLIRLTWIQQSTAVQVESR